MRVKEPDFAAVMSLVWCQAPALLVFGVVANLLLLVSRVYTLQACNDVLNTLWWLTLAALVASHHRFSSHPSSRRSGLSISTR
jgi:ATP-binding cassette, subfamily C, type I secretion system permease/ATPase